jgi:predicted PurR-regulated permease PerM
MSPTSTPSRSYRWAAILIIIALGYVVITYAKPILMPLVVAAVLSVILLPIVKTLERWKFPRLLAISLILTVLVLLIPLIGYLLFQQSAAIAEDLPELSTRFSAWYQHLVSYLDQTWGIDTTQQAAYIQSGIDRLLSGSGTFIQSTIDATTSLLGYIALIPIYMFLMLLNRERFTGFLLHLNHTSKEENVVQVINQVQAVLQNYVAGLALVIGIMAVLNVSGLLLLGIPYAVFFGLIAAFMTIIPYVGVLIGAIPPILVALLMTDSLFYPIGVIILFVMVQSLEGNVITPKIVGDKVSINPLAAMVALVIGGFVWGAIGMILSIPLTGVLKVILKSMKGGQAWADVLGT